MAYGGSSFPKQTKTMAEIAKEYGERVTLKEKITKANEEQKLKKLTKIKEKTETHKGKTIAIFKTYIQTKHPWYERIIHIGYSNRIESI